MLKVGFIGAGFVANFHARALQSVRGATLDAIYALKGAEDLAKRAEALGVGSPTIVKSIADLCKACDVACLFLPNYARVEAMRQVAASGGTLRGVIAEKPLARNVQEAAEIVKLAAGLATAYFENQIFMPAVLNARHQLAAVEKRMGPPHLIRTAEEHGGPHEPWFWDPTRQGGGVWCDMGCHSVAVAEAMATPLGKPIGYLIPVSVTANMALLKWGKKPWIDQLRDRGVDYGKTPAEDYACVSYTFKDPQTDHRVVIQATDSWMYEAPGLRLAMESMGPGYAINVNSLSSPSGIFISDAAAAAVADAELALEKAQASRGQLVVQPNEPDLYGYVGEWQDAIRTLSQKRDGLLNFAYGKRVVELVMAGYLSHEKQCTVSFDAALDLAQYVPAIQKGLGKKVML
jgi:predicted dehydrogenase